MKDIIKIIKENFILLLGTGLFIYGLFSFNSGYYCGEGALTSEGLGRIFEDFKCIDPINYYYYDDISLILLTIGTIFIIIGLLKIRKKD